MLDGGAAPTPPKGVTCVIPARLGSTRFPRKLLEPLLDKPVILHTLDRALEADCFDEIVCLTDAEEILKVVEGQGIRCVLTGEAANGTDRIARNLSSLRTQLVVNLQGDEPAFPASGLRTLCRALKRKPEWVHVLVDEEPPTDLERSNPHRVKTGLNAYGFVMDFYRQKPRYPINLSRLQLGVYGYSLQFLRRYGALPPSDRELSESHEMLRDLDLAPVEAHPSAPGASVDVPDDMALARERLLRLSSKVFA